jgi:RHS repeat-associated protein
MRVGLWLAVCIFLAAFGLPAPAALAASDRIADAPPQSVAPPSTDPQPVMSLWNATSRTYAEPDGSFQAQIFPEPVNYEDPSGSWAPIVNTLVASAAPGSAARNQAGPYALELPARLGSTPVRIQTEGSWLSFSLLGANATGSVSGTSDTFSGAMPGVDIIYTALNDGVKEVTRLQNADAPSSFTYTLATSPDLTAQQMKDGGVAFVDRSGRSRFVIPAPVVHDTAGVAGPVTMSLQTTPAASAIAVSVDPSWLSDPARVFPVEIDPTVTFGPSRQCYIQSAAPTTSSCGSSVEVGGGSAIDRTLLQFDVSSVPSDSTVTNAELGLHLGTASAVAAAISLHQVMTAWDSTASWNYASGGNVAWSTPGGDFDPAPSYTTTVGPTVGSYHWYPTQLVQGWVNGSTANDGMLLKQTTETTTDLFTFDSPVLTVTYHHWLGMQPYQPFYSRGLTDRMGVSVDLADGNLLVSSHDLQIAGTGLDLSLDRSYNSEGSGTINVGAQWELGTGAGIKLNSFADGSADYRGPDGVHYPFIRNPDGTFIKPAGLDATLVQNANGTYTLTFHADESHYDFTSSGKLTSESDRNGNQITFAYTGTTLNSITDTQGRVTSLAYGANAQITAITDPAGRTYSYGYSVADDLTTYTDPGGGVTTYAYDAQHNMTQITDPVGNITQVSYALGGVSEIVFAAGSAAQAAVSFAYSPKVPGPGTATVTDPNGHQTSYAFDGFGRETRITDPLGNTSSFTYNDDHQVTSATDPLTNVYPITYDAQHNVVSQRLPTGAISTFAYTNAAHPWSATTSTDPQGNTTTYGYDAAGDLTSVTDALAANDTATYTYKPNGRISTATDAMGHVTTYTYDANGNLKKVTPPAPLGVTKFTYDSLSRIATMTDGVGNVSTYTYDAIDRLTSTTYTGGISVSATYDTDGNLLTQTDPAGTTTYTYDALGRQTQKTLPDGATLTYTWDGQGNLRSVTDAGGTVAYTYDADDRAATITDPFGGITSLTYDADGNETRRTYPNTSFIARFYDPSSRIIEVHASAMSPFTYSYLKQGSDTTLRQSMTDGAGTTTYTYDAANRVLRALTTGSNPSDYLYTYDGVGNRLTQDANGTVTTYTYNAADELTQAGGATYTYDANGSQTGSSLGLALSYNTANQNSSATPPGGSPTAMTYAGNGQTTRTSAGSTTYRSSLLGLASETTSGVTTHYVYDPSGGLIEEWTSSSNRYFYLYDGLGSVVGLTSSSGALVNTYRYDPYGNVVAQTGTTPNRWGFAGGYRDPNTGFIKFGQRYYDPVIGRWTQTDPVAASSTRPAIASSFSYAGDDPVNNVDPTGLVLAGGGSGGHWMPRWRPHWTPRWSPGWRASWSPERTVLPRQTNPGGSRPVGGTANAGTTSGSRSGCLGAVAFGGQAGAAGGEALDAGAEAFATSLGAGLAMTGIGLLILGAAAAVIYVACK